MGTCAVVALLLLLLPLAQGAVWSGYIATKSRSVFLGKFCYTPGEGFFAMSATTWTPNVTTIEVYASTDSFENAEHLPCSNRSVLATFDFVTQESFSVSWPVWNLMKDVMATDCSGNLSKLEYSITFTNPGDPTFAAPFSADEQGLLIMYLVFTCAYIVGFAVQFWGMHRLWRIRALHPIAVILSAIIVVEFVSVFLFLEHYAVYSSNGVGHPTVKLFAELFDMAAVTTLALLCLLIAKGWGVSDNPLTHQRILLLLIIFLAAAYGVLFSWQENAIDPASSTFYYDSWPGWVIVGSRFLILGFLAYSVRTTWLEENHPNKRKFYVFFGMLSGLWLIVLPIMCGLAYTIPSWSRTRVVQAVLETVNTAALIILGFLLWPSRAAHYFKVAPPELYPATEGAPKVASNNMYEEL